MGSSMTDIAETHTLMTPQQQHPAKRLARIVALGLVAVALGACNLHNRGYTASVPQTDVSARHPIQIAGDFVDHSIPVGDAVRKLYTKEKLDLEVYLHSYKKSGAGPLLISAPVETRNEIAAVKLVAEIRLIANRLGIGDDVMVFESYTPSEGKFGFPVNLRYQVSRTVLPKCGHWPDNIAGMAKNLPYENFGCASQRNLGAMVANPHDLAVPQPSDRRYGERRSTVFDRYARGESTAAQGNQDEGGGVATVGDGG